MIGNDIPDLFRRMDAMMARMMSDMGSGSFMDLADMPDGMQGYRIVIERGDLPQESGPDFGESPHDVRARNTGEPVAEVHAIGNEVKVIVELPGIGEDALRLDLRGTTLIIDAGDADRHYRTSAELPAVDPASMRQSIKNGVLEVTFTVKSGETAGAKEA